MCVLLCACHWVISTLCPSAVKDRCSAGQVVTARGSAGLLWCPVGEHAGHPYGAAACLRLYSHTFWPNGLTEPTSVHARLRSARSGECLCTWNPYLWVQFMSLFFRFCFLQFMLSNVWTSFCLQVKSLCLSLQDSNALVQRNTLEILLYFFPFATCLVGTPCVFFCFFTLYL